MRMTTICMCIEPAEIFITVLMLTLSLDDHEINFHKLDSLALSEIFGPKFLAVQYEL